MGGWGGFGARQAASLLIPMGFLQFSRNAENEADKLGAQYMWACGYDPHALASFFEKLQVKDKKKPGTLARIFSTHPMTAERIENVNALIARFPDRNEYTLNTSEFNQVKGRLISLTNARVAGKGGSDAAVDNKRPTLKRRPQNTRLSSVRQSGGKTRWSAGDPPACQANSHCARSPAVVTTCQPGFSPGSTASAQIQLAWKPTSSPKGERSSAPNPSFTDALPPNRVRLVAIAATCASSSPRISTSAAE